MILCCNRCFEKIALESTDAAKLWLDMCGHASDFGYVLKLREWRVPHTLASFRKLEQLRFIDSLDGMDAVTLRVNGFKKIDVEGKLIDTYCINREGHDHDWK